MFFTTRSSRTLVIGRADFVSNCLFTLNSSRLQQSGSSLPQPGKLPSPAFYSPGVGPHAKHATIKKIRTPFPRHTETSMCSQHHRRFTTNPKPAPNAPRPGVCLRGALQRQRCTIVYTQTCSARALSLSLKHRCWNRRAMMTTCTADAQRTSRCQRHKCTSEECPIRRGLLFGVGCLSNSRTQADHALVRINWFERETTERANK